MSHDTLAIIWFALWGVLWAVYFILESYTSGTGMLFSFIAKDRQERNQLQETVGPFWGGNEVWLITAGGATFAAFPITYANMFSWLYTPLMLILFALFFRATGLEFMHKDDNPKWQASWKWAYNISSFLIPLLFGVAFANLYYGLQVTENGYEGTLLSLLHPYGLLGGVLFVALSLLSGSLWISIKNAGPVAERAKRLITYFWVISVAVLAIFFVATNNRTPLLDKFADYPVLWVFPVLTLVLLVLVKPFASKGKFGWAWIFTALSFLMLMATGFIGMFPNMLPTIDPQYSVNLFDARGSAKNLQIMFIVALIFVPIVIAYQTWAHWLFRKKIDKDEAKGYH